MKITSINVVGTLIAVIQNCGLDLLIIIEGKNIAQGKDMENMSTQETVLVL